MNESMNASLDKILSCGDHARKAYYIIERLLLPSDITWAKLLRIRAQLRDAEVALRHAEHHYMATHDITDEVGAI